MATRIMEHLPCARHFAKLCLFIPFNLCKNSCIYAVVIMPILQEKRLRFRELKRPKFISYEEAGQMN